MKRPPSAEAPVRRGVLTPVLRTALLVFLFLRFFYDGLSSPLFNHVSNAALVILAAVRVARSRFEEPLLPEELFLLLYWLWSAVSSGFSGVRLSGAEHAGQLMGHFCFFFLFVRTFRPTENAAVSRTFFAAAALIVAYGIYQYHWGFAETRAYVYSNPELLANAPPTFLDRLKSDRIYATFVYPNVFACFLLAVLALGYFRAIRPPAGAAAGAALAVSLAAAYALALTGSFAGFLVFLFVCQAILLSLVLGGRRLAVALAVLCALETAALVILLRAELLPHSASFRDRLLYWRAAAAVFARSPVFGVGPENYGIRYLSVKPPAAMEARHAHSLFFETLAETGAVGTILLFGFLGACLFRAFRGSRGSPLRQGIAFALLGVCLHNLLDFDFVDPSSSALVFFLGAWGAVNDPEGRAGARFALTRGAWCLIIVCAFLGGVAAVRAGVSGALIDSSRGARDAAVRLAAAEAAGRWHPSPDVDLARAEAYDGLSLRDARYAAAAETAYLSALAGNPYAPRVYRGLAALYERRGDAARAREMHRALLKVYPSKKQYVLEAALFYRRIGDRAESAALVGRAARLAPASLEEERIVREYEQWIESRK